MLNLKAICFIEQLMNNLKKKERLLTQVLSEYIALSQPLQPITEIIVKASDYLQVRYLEDARSIDIRRVKVKVLSYQI